MPNFLPFKFNQRKPVTLDVIKGITSGDDLHTDEQGRHLIFRTIGGKVRPIRVGAEEFADWLVNQGVEINPADQKTLRELDRELEIMERAAEYGGPQLQKQYEDYFKQRREQYAQMALQYYQQAIQNQAKQANVAPESLLEAKNVRYGEAEAAEDEPVRREDLPRRNWEGAFVSWVENQDKLHNLTPANDQWYYNRIYGVLLSGLSEAAEKGMTLAELDFDKVFSVDFIKASMGNYYGEFFGSTGGDPKKILAGINQVRSMYFENNLNKRDELSNFMNYWYGRMQDDFSRAQQETLESSPVTEAFKDIPEDAIPAELPRIMSSHEGSSLLGLYRKASGSKLNAAHRVMIHSLARLVDSVPMNERVKMVVELTHGKTGVNALHREGYKRAYHEYNSLGLIPERDDLVSEAINIATRSANGSTKQKINAIKRISMIMGTIDGAAVIQNNPGIQDSMFTRKWHDSAINAGRVRAEGPGLIDILTDDEKRNAHTYTNQDLKILRGDAFPEEAETTESVSPEVESSGYTFSGSKMILDNGFELSFAPESQEYLAVTVSSPDGAHTFETRVANPPIPISKMSEEDRSSYLESVKTQVEGEIQRYKNSLPKDESEGVYEIPESGTFRVPLFDFGENLTTEDREFLGDVIQHVEEGGLQVSKLMDNAYRVVNPSNNKFFDILFNKSKRRLVGMGEDDEGGRVPFTELSIQDFSSSLGYRSGE